MKKSLFLLLCSGILFTTQAQQVVRCTTMEDDSAMRVRLGLPPLEDFESWLQVKIAAYKNSPEYLSGQRSVMTIPIVFHVIHDGDAVGTGENISQAQINSQIESLNEDFRKEFGTAGYNTNPVGADCEIEFCPAVVDPNGTILTEPGIHRVNLGQAEWTQTECNQTIKPQTIWDPARYCNVWTVRFGGSSANLLGYAQFPSSSGLQGLNNNGGSSTTDGVVIRYNSCGRVGTVAAPYNKGRTLTHELGHWLGLRHIWGDQNCGNDYCNDTPTAEDANYTCNVGNVTCGSVDMVENYMDYSTDGCMNIFTNDQKTRMVTVMNASPRRNSLLNSNVCTIPFTFSYTGRVIDATTNQGIANAKVWMDGPADYTPTTDANGYFTISNLQQDNYSVYAGKWGYITANLSQQAFNTNTPQITIALQKGYYDDFVFDFGWTETGNATTGNWERGVPVGTSYTTGGTTYQSNPATDVTGDYGNAAYITGNAGGGSGDDDIDGGSTTLTSPAMDLSTYTEPIIRYYRWFFNSGGSGSPNDSLIVSLVNGTQSVDVDVVGRTAATNVWAFKSIRVKDYFANPGNNVTIKLRTFDTDPGHLVEAAFDLFRVLDSSGTALQPPVANFGSSVKTACVGQPIAFNDLSSNNPGTWTWSFPGGSPTSSASSNPSVTYNTPGTYNVSLTVSNGWGSNSITQNAYVTVEGIVAQFAQDADAVCPGYQVTFSNGSLCNPTAFSWQFPGGSPASSTDANPVVTYFNPGYYNVTLVAGNQTGADTLVQNLAIQVYRTPSLATTAVSDTDNTGLGTATVTVNNGTPPYTYKWSDPQQQTTETATGLTAGLYTVSVVDGNGCNSITSITVPNTIVNGLSSLAASFIQVYPNPVKGNSLFVKTGAEWKNGTLTVTDVLGRKTYSTVIQETELSIDARLWATGVYTIHLSAADKKASAKIVRE